MSLNRLLGLTDSSVMRSPQPICVIPLVNVLIFSAYLFQNTMLLISVSTRRAHSKRACFNESRMFDVIHYITVTISVTISITIFFWTW